MIKQHELTDPNSCTSRARDKEMTFVLLARDKAAPWAVRAWCLLRVFVFRKNRWRDDQIQEAMRCANEMYSQRMSSQAAPEKGK